MSFETAGLSVREPGSRALLMGALALESDTGLHQGLAEYQEVYGGLNPMLVRTRYCMDNGRRKLVVTEQLLRDNIPEFAQGDHARQAAASRCVRMLFNTCYEDAFDRSGVEEVDAIRNYFVRTRGERRMEYALSPGMFANLAEREDLLLQLPRVGALSASYLPHYRDRLITK